VWVTPTGELAGGSEFNTLGYRGDERAGRHIGEVIHPDDLPRVFDIIERARSTAGFEEKVQARARHKDGSWHLFDAVRRQPALELCSAVRRRHHRRAQRPWIETAEDGSRFLPPLRCCRRGSCRPTPTPRAD
jgi:PAS domain-containing protein